MLVAQPNERAAGLGGLQETRTAIAEARRAQVAWSDTPLPKRLHVLRRFRNWLAENASQATQWINAPWRSHAAETLAAEILPLLEACRFLEENAGRILQPREPGGRRPFWMGRTAARIERDPLGLVLVLGPANYPLFLPGTQTLQALAAGNAVLWKPGRFGAGAADGMRRGLLESGLPAGVLHALQEDEAPGLEAIRCGVDKVVLTGSVETGRTVLAESARALTPSTMELSGVDACFVLASADLELVTNALRFGIEWNSGFTCIAPRRVFVDMRVAGQLAARLESLELNGPGFSPVGGEQARVRDLIDEAESRGARRLGSSRSGSQPFEPKILYNVPPDADILRQDPQSAVVSIVPVSSMDQALEIDALCPYSLGATIFGDGASAQDLARRVNAGIVVINDLIAPTADPRLPFGGRGASGFGVTRGADGLLAMTRPKAVIERRGGFRPHLEPARPAEDRALFESYIQTVHARGAVKRLKGMRRLVSVLAKRSR